MCAGRRQFVTTLGTALLAGCFDRSGTAPRTGTTDRDSTGRGSPETPEPTGSESDGRIGYTHLRADGNRHVGGSGRVPETEPIAVEIDGSPAWLVAATAEGGSILAAVSRDGEVDAFRIADGSATPTSIIPERLPPGMPPVLSTAGEEPRILTPPPGGATGTHPVPIGGGTKLAVVDEGGAVRLRRDGETIASRSVGALPDARLLRDGRGGIVLLAGRTDRYGHGVLGDAIEASEIVRLRSDDLSVETRIEIPDGAVVEGVSPILANVTGSDHREFVVTESDATDGARQVVYGADGERLADGPPIGTGYRWRHQLAVAAFAPDGRRELAVVRTPHIGGTVEFYRHDGDDLRIVATASGYSSHEIGSRILDGGVAGDLDGDGRVELLLPTDDRTVLAALRRTETGVTEAWKLSLGGDLATNVLANRSTDGTLVAAGRDDGTVLIWGEPIA